MRCRKPGYNRLTWCVEESGHEGCHTYSPDAEPEEEKKLSNKLEWVMRLVTQSCPDYRIGDFVTTRPKCCPYHEAADVIKQAQRKLRDMHE